MGVIIPNEIQNFFFSPAPLFFISPYVTSPKKRSIVISFSLQKKESRPKNTYGTVFHTVRLPNSVIAIR